MRYFTSEDYLESKAKKGSNFSTRLCMNVTRFKVNVFRQKKEIKFYDTGPKRLEGTVFKIFNMFLLTINFFQIPPLYTICLHPANKSVYTGSQTCSNVRWFEFNSMAQFSQTSTSKERCLRRGSRSSCCAWWNCWRERTLLQIQVWCIWTWGQMWAYTCCQCWRLDTMCGGWMHRSKTWQRFCASASPNSLNNHSIWVSFLRCIRQPVPIKWAWRD